MTGKLKKVFNDLHEQKFYADLSGFCFGGRERKFYISDNMGLIRQYNMKNGQIFKSVNQLKELELSDFSKKQGHIKKKENNEVSAIFYHVEQKLLIAAYWDSTIRIYDENDAEESVLIKVLSGGHRQAEINCLSFSPNLSLLASGSSNGMIAIWDFEMG